MAGRIQTSACVLAAILFLPALAIGATSQFRQGVNGYLGTVDTHVRLDQPTSRFENFTFVHIDNNNPIAHGLIRFDHIVGNGPGQVPFGALIESARLTLRTSNLSDPVWFHRMLVPWEETNNWNELSTSGPGLQADDIEMSATPDFTFTPSSPVPRIDTFDVTATVQGWLAGSFPNYGWGITNQVSDGWQFDSSENAAVANRPMLEITFASMPSIVEIVRHPTNITVVEGDSATFSVVVSGTDPSFQWFKDNIPIPDATNSAHTIALVRRADEGTYYLTASNSASGPVNSSNAFLMVIDGGPPSVRCAYGTNDDRTIFVVFSQIVTNGNDRANYSVFPPSDPSASLTVATAVYSGGATEGTVVILTLDPSTPLGPGGSYVLSVGGVSNRFGDPIDPNEITLLTLYLERVFTISDSHVWKYDDSGNDPGESWKNRDFDDSSWSSGLPLFGFETAVLPEPLRTPLNRTNGFGNSTRTYYFRTHFSQFGATRADVLRFRTVLDDAAAIYLNGAEIFRIRLPAGPLNYMTEGVGASVGDAAYEGPFTVCVSNLANGDNVLAVEVHQTGANSGDLVFGMELSALSPDPPPTCFGRQPTNQIVNAGNPVTFIIDYRCPYSAVQWFKNDAAISGATNLTYTIGSVFPRDQGNYYAVINGTQSATAQLTVLSCCAPEIISMYGTNGTIVLVFNELTTNGLELSNFRIMAANGSHELMIGSTEYTTGTNTGTTLLLRVDETTPLRANVPYNLYLEDIEDLFENRIEAMTVPVPLFSSVLLEINAAQQWRYEILGTDLTNTWYGLAYDDSAWPMGAALFDANRPPRAEVNSQLVRTTTTLSNSQGTAQIPTHYFRTRFNYAGPATHTICIRPFIDDGAVYYLNGREILRVGMPPVFQVQYGTFANRTIVEPSFEGPYYVGVTNLVAGDNLLAVEVHQASLTSSDLTFGTEFGLLSTVPPRRLNMSVTNGTHAVLTWGGSAILEQNTSLDANDWTPVHAAVSGYTSPLSGSKFFRLREP